MYILKKHVNSASVIQLIMLMCVFRLQELTVCSEDNVDVHDIELMQYINVDCSKLKRLLQGSLPLFYILAKPLRSCLHDISASPCLATVRLGSIVFSSAL